MIINQLALQRAQRAVFKALREGVGTGIKAVPEYNISTPAHLRQEILLNAAQNVYEFNFGTPTQANTAVFNNILLGDNDIFACYGLKILLGVGANTSGRIYNSVGIVPADDVLYNGELSMEFESSTPVIKMETQIFRENVPFHGYSGFQFINPLRYVTGRLGVFRVRITLPATAALVFTPNTYISVTLEGGLGRA